MFFILYLMVIWESCIYDSSWTTEEIITLSFSSAKWLAGKWHIKYRVVILLCRVFCEDKNHMQFLLLSWVILGWSMESRMMNGAIYQNHHLIICVGLCGKHYVPFMNLDCELIMCMRENRYNRWCLLQEWMTESPPHTKYRFTCLSYTTYTTSLISNQEITFI